MQTDGHGPSIITLTAHVRQGLITTCLPSGAHAPHYWLAWLSALMLCRVHSNYIRGGYMYRTSEPLLNYAVILEPLYVTQDKDKAKRMHHAKGHYSSSLLLS